MVFQQHNRQGRVWTLDQGKRMIIKLLSMFKLLSIFTPGTRHLAIYATGKK